ncbi:MAG: class I SAM-dependent methyltransferase [Sphingobacteriaceae bacterium]|nr:class I SAM-dependent methyltransferase [Sphingobacteriaceae bacterium]
MLTNQKDHWENIYQTKQPQDVSWTQDIPAISLFLMKDLKLSKDAPIIDIGGGDSLLVDFLLKEGFTDISVLDISSGAIQRTKQRLGKKADEVKWIVSDINDFVPDRQFKLWHDRATFHFLTKEEQQTRYVQVAQNAVVGNLIIGTFSKSGPTKCSNLPIQQYDESDMVSKFGEYFSKVECISEDHMTPSGKLQNFTFCNFSKK